MDEASTVLGVPRNASLEALRRRYRVLVKQAEGNGRGRGSRLLQDVSIAYTKLLSLHTSAASTSANNALTGIGASSADQASDDDADVDVDVGEMKAFMTVIRELSGVFSTSAPAFLGGLPLLFSASVSSAAVGVAACDSDDSDGLLELSGSDEDGLYGGTWVTTDEGEGGASSSSSSSWFDTDWTGRLLGLLSRLTGIYMLLGTGLTGIQGGSVHSGLSLGLAGYDGGGRLEDKDRPKKTKRRHDRRKKLKEKKAAVAAVAAAAECTEVQAQDRAREDTARAKDELYVARRELFLGAARGDVSGLEYMLGPESCVSAKGTGLGLKVTDVCDGSLGADFGGEMEGRSLQHFCLTGVAMPGSSQWREGPLRADRLACLKLLVARASPAVSLCAADKGCITVLHLAAQRADATALQWLLHVPAASSPDHTAVSKGGSGTSASNKPKRIRDERFRVKMSDINQRCSLRGFTPMHYAAEAGAAESVRSLVEVGAVLNIHALSGSKGAERGPTPLELVTQMLQQAEACGSSGSNSGGGGAAAPESALCAVRDVLADAVATLEASRRAKEDEAAGSKERARERTRSKDLASETPPRPRLGSKDSVGSADSGGRHKARTRTESDGGMAAATAAAASTAAVTTDRFADTGHGTGAGGWEVTAKKKRRGKADAGDRARAGAGAGAGTGAATAIGSVSPLTAPSKRMPLLAVRPEDSVDVSASTAAPAAVAMATATAGVTQRDNSTASSRPPSTVVANDADPGGSIAPSPEELLRIEHDRREEQRRIYRAWNAKAEEEKRMADAEKGRRERERAQAQSAQHECTSSLMVQHAEKERMRARHLLTKSVQGAGPPRGAGSGPAAPHSGDYPSLADYGGLGAAVESGGDGDVGDGGALGATAMRALEQGVGAFGAVSRGGPIAPQHARSHAHAHLLSGTAAATAAMPVGPGGLGGDGGSSFGSIPAFGPAPPRRAPRPQTGGVHRGGSAELHMASRGGGGDSSSSSRANMGTGLGAGAFACAGGSGAYGGHGPESLADSHRLPAGTAACLPEDMRLALMTMPAFEQATPVSKRNASGSSRTDRYNPLVYSPHQQQVHALAQQQLKMQQHSMIVSPRPSGLSSMGAGLPPMPQGPDGGGVGGGVLQDVQGALAAGLSGGDGIDLSAGADPFVPLFDDGGAALDLMRPPGMAPGRSGSDRGGHGSGASSKHGSTSEMLATGCIDLASLSTRLGSDVGAPFRGMGLRSGESTASHDSDSYAVDNLLDVDVSALALDFLDGGRDERGGGSQY